LNSTRLTFRIHSWLGLVTGAFLLVIALTGVYLVYEAELDRLFNPEIRTRPVALHPVPVDAVLRAARADFGDHHIGLVTFPADARAPYVASLRKMTPKGDFVRYQVYVDAGTGAVIAHRVSSYYLTSWILRLHEGLWLPERWGQPIVAVLGIVMALMGLTGLWVYRKRIWDALRWKRSAQRIGRLHAHLGVWSMLFAVLLGVTGTILNFSSLLVVCRAPPVPLMGSDWSILDRIPSVDALIAETHRVFPDLEVHGVYFPNHSGDPVKIGGYAPGAHILGKSSYVAFAVSPSPRVVEIYDARRVSWAMQLLLMTNSLHYGDFAGDGSKSLYVLGGLVMTFLAGSGLWIRLRPRAR
jgi:uncharacterized iron-regulated membrane protein